MKLCPPHMNLNILCIIGGCQARTPAAQERQLQAQTSSSCLGMKAVRVMMHKQGDGLAKPELQAGHPKDKDTMCSAVLLRLGREDPSEDILNGKVIS